jgi:hypothetical protein
MDQLERFNPAGPGRHAVLKSVHDLDARFWQEKKYLKNYDVLDLTTVLTFKRKKTPQNGNQVSPRLC